MTLKSAMHTLPETDVQLSELVKLGYRFTRPHIPRNSYSESTPPQNLVKAIVLDTETTGLDSKTEHIIELGMVLFEYCPESGQAYRVLDTFNELEDPETPIPPETAKIHNITDDMVRGKKIDDVAVQNFIAEASLIIAHNAKFDRSFVEARFPFLEQKAWACSVAQIPWVEEGLGSAKLEFLAYRYGFHYDGHRASNDCHALLELLQQKLPESGVMAMLKLQENAQAKELKVWALNSPFESKDALKQRGYRWNATRKTWSLNMADALLNQEVDWLKEMVYGGQPFQLELERMNALNRFSSRKSDAEIVKF